MTFRGVAAEITYALVLHSTTPYETTVIDSQMDPPVTFLISMSLEVLVAPGTKAVITVPPIDPVFGVMETNYGVISS